jgi:hypothetical protein
MSSRVRSFTTKDPELNRKLVQLEDALYALFAASADSHRLELVTPVLKNGYIARPGQLVRVAKPVEMLLAVPKIDDAGLPLVIWNQSGGAIELRTITGTINGAAGTTLSNQRAYRLESDGTNYAGEF